MVKKENEYYSMHWKDYLCGLLLQAESLAEFEQHLRIYLNGYDAAFTEISLGPPPCFRVKTSADKLEELKKDLGL